MIKKIIYLTLLFSLVCVPNLRAEFVALKSGKIIEGTIVKETKDYIKLDTGIGIDLTYYFEDIDVIVEDISELEEKSEMPEKIYSSEEEKVLTEIG